MPLTNTRLYAELDTEPMTCAKAMTQVFNGEISSFSAVKVFIETAKAEELCCRGSAPFFSHFSFLSLTVFCRQYDLLDAVLRRLGVLCAQEEYIPDNDFTWALFISAFEYHDVKAFQKILTFIKKFFPESLAKLASYDPQRGDLEGYLPSHSALFSVFMSPKAEGSSCSLMESLHAVGFPAKQLNQWVSQFVKNYVPSNNVVAVIHSIFDCLMQKNLDGFEQGFLLMVKASQELGVTPQALAREAITVMVKNLNRYKERDQQFLAHLRWCFNYVQPSFIKVPITIGVLFKSSLSLDIGAVMDVPAARANLKPETRAEVQRILSNNSKHQGVRLGVDTPSLLEEERRRVEVEQGEAIGRGLVAGFGH